MKHLLLLLALFSSSAFAGERQVSNPDEDGNLVLRVNDGGVVKDALTIIGSSGLITTSGQPYVEAYNSVGDTGAGSGNVLTVDYDTEVVASSDFASDTWTAPVTGVYQLCAYAALSATVGFTAVYLDITAAGVVSYVMSDLSATGILRSLGGCILHRMTASQTAFARVSATVSSGTWGVNAGQGATHFSAALIQ